MAELPEVEHAARLLSSWLHNKRIERAEADATRVLRGPDRGLFLDELTRRRVHRVDRFGAIIAVEVDGVTLLCRMGTTGKWIRQRPGRPPPPHSRARLVLEGGDTVHFDDERENGRLTVHDTFEVSALPEIATLGPDPLREGIDPERLAQALGPRRDPIALALIDPKVIAGLGIVQSAEARFRARVHPATISSALSLDQLRAIAQGVGASIAHTLAAIRDEDVFYLPMERGRSPFLVHDRLGGNCPRCDTEIASVVEAGQTVAYCPSCQPAQPSAKG